MTSKTSHSSFRGYSFPNINFLESLRPTKMKLGLENIKRLLEQLGNPQEKFPALHVGGTNGKGSVTTFISSMLGKCGLKVGTFYSPHLFRINERIRINGEEIPSAVLEEILGKLRNLYSKTPFTYFEGITAAAILYFLQNNVDIAVFEVGLGGRLDATKLVNSVISVITGISLDHCRHLGATKREILIEKLGIVKKGVPVVMYLDDENLIEIAVRHCDKTGSPLYNAYSETSSRITYIEPGGISFHLETGKRNYGEIVSGMTGRHQLKNIATSVMVVEVLESLLLWKDKKEEYNGRIKRASVARPIVNDGKRQLKLVGYDLKSCIEKGLRDAFFCGRFQVISSSPMVILDVAHNEEALIASVKTLCEISPPGRNVIVFSYLSRKDPGSFPEHAAEAARRIFTTPLDSEQGAEREKLESIFEQYMDDGRIEISEDIKSAMSEAWNEISEGDCLLILGSHLMVEEAAAFL